MDEYHIVTESPHGSDYALFWRPNRRGYTRIIDEAGRYSWDEAKAICKLRGEEVMVRCDLVNKRAIRVVDHANVIADGEK